jgi:predicted metalloprotease
MRLDDENQSRNVEDRRGQRSGGRRAGGIGIGTIAMALVALYFGVDPSVVLNIGQGIERNRPTQVESNAAPVNDAMSIFVKKVLNNTERTWTGIFQNGGSRYPAPKLVLFTGATNTRCGDGHAAMGPFYCPADKTIYIDLAFYDEMKRKFKAPGDFAQAYVIAHEVGHHIQNIVGTSDKVQRAKQQAGSKAQANQLSVRLELQADCYAGVWAYNAKQENRIEVGDVQEAMTAAAAIGDDALQKKAQGYAVPDSFTHGTSEQRMRWFNQGLKTGDIQQCDTFNTARL